MKRILATAVAVMAATAGVVVAPPSPALAIGCYPSVGTTYRDGNNILGSGGGSSGWGCSYDIKIMWHRWSGATR